MGVDRIPKKLNLAFAFWRRGLAASFSALILAALACGGVTLPAVTTSTVSGKVKGFFCSASCSNEVPGQIVVAMNGRSDITATTNQASGDCATGFDYTLEKVPAQDNVVVQISGSVQASITFPFEPVPDTTNTETFGFVSDASLDSLKARVVSDSSSAITLDVDKGIILGAVSSGNRPIVKGVALFNSTEQPAVVDGPFYFKADPSEAICHDLATSYDASNGLYFFVNVTPGNYFLRFCKSASCSGGADDVIDVREVAIAKAGLAIGMDIP